ncbi:hypothetical protein G9A89_000414 [Geosiphon pyriformis]|nr:hypothetical protein G9A89_000414 [Geosiphon pyriformis]
MDLSNQILQLLKQLFDVIQQFSAQIEITINKKKLWYKDKSRKEENESSTRTKYFFPYTPPKKQYWRKNCFWAEGEKEREKRREKGYKRRYLVPEIEEIKKSLSRGTELPETGEWTLDNAQE